MCTRSTSTTGESLLFNNNNDNNDNSDHFYSAISHRQGWTHHAYKSCPIYKIYTSTIMYKHNIIFLAHHTRALLSQSHTCTRAHVLVPQAKYQRRWGKDWGGGAEERRQHLKRVVVVLFVEPGALIPVFPFTALLLHTFPDWPNGIHFVQFHTFCATGFTLFWTLN